MPNSQEYQIKLAWLNSLGGWEFWNFVSRKTKGYQINSGRNSTIIRDIENNWDDYFISGQTQKETLTVKANKTTTVRSQLLTDKELEAIARINLSVKVVDIDQNKTVVIDGSSFEYRTEGVMKNLGEISFVISYPSEQIQSL